MNVISEARARIKECRLTMPLAGKLLAVFAVDTAKRVEQSIDCFEVEKGRPRVFNIRDEPAVEMFCDHGEERFASGREAIEVRANSNASLRCEHRMRCFGVHVPEVV